MLQIQDTLVSFDVVEKEFICDLEACRGACCIEGDAGAPIDEEVLQFCALFRCPGYPSARRPE